MALMMLDEGIVAVSPASVDRVLHEAGRLGKQLRLGLTPKPWLGQAKVAG